MWARVLSTPDLGCDRYNAARNSGKWPVELRFSDHSSALDAVKCVVTHLSGVTVDVHLERILSKEWVALLIAPTGSLMYSILAGDTIIAMGSIDVQPPPPPNPADLNCKFFARVVHVSEDGSHGMVEFVYGDSHAREVFVEGDEEIGCVRLAWYEDESVFRAIVPHIPVGSFTFRFRVYPLKPTNPQDAPFTSLGWDTMRCKPDSLVTWEQPIAVQPPRMRRRHLTKVRIRTGKLAVTAAVCFALVAIYLGAMHRAMQDEEDENEENRNLDTVSCASNNPFLQFLG